MQGVYDEAALKALLGPALRALPRGGQTALARAVGVEPQTVNKWAKEQTCPDPARWGAIEDFLGWEAEAIARQVIPALTSPLITTMIAELTDQVAKLTDRVAALERRVPRAGRSGS